MTTTYTYYRRSQNQHSPFNGRLGYGMFAFCENGGARVESYGPYLWSFSGPAVAVAEVIAAANAAGFEDEFGFDASCLDPKNILESAEGWDDSKIVTWIWEHVCEGRDWLAIETSDGAILFDKSLATYVGL